VEATGNLADRENPRNQRPALLYRAGMMTGRLAMLRITGPILA
jgi:hypothetical protein